MMQKWEGAPRLLSGIVAFNAFPSHIGFQGISPLNEVGEEVKRRETLVVVYVA